MGLGQFANLRGRLDKKEGRDVFDGVGGGGGGEGLRPNAYDDYCF